MVQTYVNWSGGKDCTLALYRVLQQKELHIASLLTTMGENTRRISMHGVHELLLERQAESIGIPLQKVLLPESSSMAAYNQQMQQAVNILKEMGCSHAVFGDIFLEDLRRYRDEQLAAAGITGIYPLWQQSSREVALEFIRLGFKAIVVCVNGKLDKQYCGHLFNEDFLNSLPAETDPCGENGEFHTFVYDGPLFSFPVPFTRGETVWKTYGDTKNADTSPTWDTGFWFLDLVTAPA